MWDVGIKLPWNQCETLHSWWSNEVASETVVSLHRPDSTTSPLSCGYMWNKIILKIFQRFISHVTTEVTVVTCEIKHWNNFTLYVTTSDIISNLFQNNFISHVTTALVQRQISKRVSNKRFVLCQAV